MTHNLATVTLTLILLMGNYSMTTSENYTSFEEFVNGTNPIRNDTDGDDWDDGPEVYYQDQDGDGMASGWEYYFNFDPFDDVDRMVDTDGDGHVNYCEYKWDTNPRTSIVSLVKDNCVIRSRSSR